MVNKNSINPILEKLEDLNNSIQFKKPGEVFEISFEMNRLREQIKELISIIKESYHE